MLREADSSPAGWLPQTVLQLTKGRQFPWRPAHSVVHWTWVWSPLRCSLQQTTSEEPGLSLFTDILGRYLLRRFDSLVFFSPGRHEHLMTTLWTVQGARTVRLFGLPEEPTDRLSKTYREQRERCQGRQGLALLNL